MTDARESMLILRAALLELHPDIKLARDLGPLMGEHEREYWIWTVETMEREISVLRGPKYTEIKPETCGDSRHVDGLGTVRCGIYPGHTGEHRGGAQGRRFMWLPEGVEWHE
jgi:hypothetical protein